MRKIKLLIISLIMAGGFLISAVPVYARVQGQLTANHVRVREYPCLENNYNILFQVNRGQVVEILDIAGDFYRVNVRDSREVYIFREFIEEVAEVEEAAEEEIAEEVIEEEAIEEEAIEEEIAEEAEVYETEETEAPKYTRYISFSIEDLLYYAKTYLGTPYRFGSTDPSRGLDCSGFVTIVMRRFDISLSRSSRDMAANNGVQVARNELKPGDLVFFNTNGRNISHVGIYIGDDKFIHSASRGVVITAMGETYWRNRFVRANRVI